MCTRRTNETYSHVVLHNSRLIKPYFERDCPSVDRGSRILSCQHGHFLFGFIHSPRELKKKPQLKRQMSVSSLILTWCKDVTQEYEVSALENVWLKRSSKDYTKRKVIALTSRNKHSIKPTEFLGSCAIALDEEYVSIYFWPHLKGVFYRFFVYSKALIFVGLSVITIALQLYDWEGHPNKLSL